MSHGLSIFQEGKSGGKDTIKLETNAEGAKVCGAYQIPILSTISEHSGTGLMIIMLINYLSLTLIIG